MANSSIPSDLLEELQAAMGKPLPEEAKERMAYWKTLRQDHPALASQLLSYIRPGKTTLVSAVEHERQKVNRKEQWHSLLRGILYQENLSSENVPNRKRWVFLAAGAFVAMVGISAVLYSTKPKTDVKLGSPVAAAASAVLPKEESLPEQNQAAVGSEQALPSQTQTTGPTTAATTETAEALPESLIPKSTATGGRVLVGNGAPSQPSAGPAPLVEWGPPPPPPAPRSSYPQAYPPRTSSYGPYVTTPPVQPIPRLSSAANPSSPWYPPAASNTDRIASPLSSTSNTTTPVTPPRIQGSGVIQSPELGAGQLQGGNNIDPPNKTHSDGEPLVMTRETAAPRAPIATADGRGSNATPSPSQTSNPQAASVVQKAEAEFPEQQTEVVSDARLAEPLVAQGIQDTANLQTPQVQSKPPATAPGPSRPQTVASPISSSQALTQDSAIDEPLHLSTQPSAEPKSMQRPGEVNQVAASLPKQEATSSVNGLKQVADNAPLVALRTAPAQLGTMSGNAEAEEVWVASRQRFAQEGLVASNRLWETPPAQSAGASLAEPFTAQRTPKEKAKPVLSGNPATKPTQPPQPTATSPVGASTSPTPLPGNNAQDVPPDGTLLEATLLTSIVTAEGASVPVIAQSTDGNGDDLRLQGNWIGTASLNPLGRVSIRFHQWVGAGGSLKILASAFDPEGVPGVAATLEDHAPSLAADLLRAGVSGFSTFAQSLLQSGSTSVSGGVVVKEQKVPPLEYILGGEIAKLFQLPTAHQSVVRVARVAKGSPILIAVGVSIEGLEGR